jgi:hypothetical protein
LLAASDSITVTIEADRDIADSNTLVDLWAAVQLSDGTLLFFTEDAETNLTTTPTPFATGLERSDQSTTVFDFQITSGLEGEYRFYAIFNEAGAGIDHLDQTMRSNLAFQDIIVQ